MMQTDSSWRENHLNDLCDRDYFMSHALFSKQKHAIQIQLFYDNFVTANPLGSKWGIRKLGAIYFALQNFSPKYNWSLHNVHLVSLFHAQDIKTYGFPKILEPLVQDIKILERDGIMVPLYDQPVYGTIVQVTGDNLGLHCLVLLNRSVPDVVAAFVLLRKRTFRQNLVKIYPRWLCERKHFM